ncbi:MAG: glutamate racemase [Bacillota bacterium]
MPFDDRPIGVFDSGIGGLTVARLIQQQFPGEDIIYVGDTAHLPYGDKSVSELIEYARRIMDFLAKSRVKAIVAACNTSSSVSVDILRERYAVPVIGVVKPGARAAVRVSENRRIGVLATEVTAKSSAYRKEILAIQKDAKVWEIPCPALVPAVEAGRIADPEIRELIASYLCIPLENQADTIILGCTHYPYLQPVIEEVTRGRVNIVDPALETVNELKQVLDRLQGYAERDSGKARFFATGATDSFTRVGFRFYGRDSGRVERVKI